MNIKKVLVASSVIVACTVGAFMVLGSANEPLKVVETGGDVSQGFKTVEELKNSAEAIVEVTTTDVDSTKYANVVFTISKAKVTKIYKGSLQVNDTLNILETGGISGDTNYLFEGNEAFKKNEKAIVFIKKYEGPVARDAYVILGAYQGKFKVDAKGALEAPKKAFGEISNVKSLSDLKLN